MGRNQTEINNKRKKRGCGCFLLFAAAAVMLVRFALYDGLAVREYTVKSGLVTGEHTYILISDLHSTYYGEHQEELAALIMGYMPEAVFLAGDIADDKEDRRFGGTAELLSCIADLYPCYYIAGNHECWLDYTEDIHGMVREYGVTVISGESADLGDGIALHGIDDPLFYGGNEEFLSELKTAEVSEEKFDILLSHRPEYAGEYAEHGFDLVLAGHAHGGQARIPLLLNGLYAPNQGWFPEYAGGKYNLGGSTMIVSRGLMKDDLPRIFNRPELVVIQLTGK